MIPPLIYASRENSECCFRYVSLSFWLNSCSTCASFFSSSRIFLSSPEADRICCSSSLFFSFSFLISRSTLSVLPIQTSAGFPWLSPSTLGFLPSAFGSSFPSARSALSGSSKKIFRPPFSSCPIRYSPTGSFPDFSLLMYTSCGSDSLPDPFSSAASFVSFASFAFLLF